MDNGPLRGDAVQEDNELGIPVADDDTAGEYICSATNQFGSAKAEPVRLVVVDSKSKKFSYYK